MRVVAALGGNALLRRGQPLTAENQRANIAVAARALLPIALEHDLILTHGNGPQVGLLSLQNAAYHPEEEYPLDILDAETEGMIGYLLEQELGNLLPHSRPMATILTRIEVDPADPAFAHPTKPIGPVYDREEAERHAVERSWTIAPDGDKWRRGGPVAAAAARSSRSASSTCWCARRSSSCARAGAASRSWPTPDGDYEGVEAVIDKDFAGALLRDLAARGRVPDADRRGRRLRGLGHAGCAAGPPGVTRRDGVARFAAGSMGPKVEAACRFVRAELRVRRDRGARGRRGDAPRRGRHDGDPAGNAAGVGDRAPGRERGGVEGRACQAPHGARGREPAPHGAPVPFRGAASSSRRSARSRPSSRRRTGGRARRGR